MSGIDPKGETGTNQGSTSSLPTTKAKGPEGLKAKKRRAKATGKMTEVQKTKRRMYDTDRDADGDLRKFLLH